MICLLLPDFLSFAFLRWFLVCKMPSVANPEISVTDSFFVSLDLLECLCALPRLNKLLHTTRNTPEVIYLIKEITFFLCTGERIVSVRKM